MWKSNTLIFQKLHIYMHKKYHEKWGSAYLRVKNARAFKTLPWTLANIGSLCSPNSASLHWQNLGKNFRPPPPPDQILDLLQGRGRRQLLKDSLETTSWNKRQTCTHIVDEGLMLFILRILYYVEIRRNNFCNNVLCKGTLFRSICSL